MLRPAPFPAPLLAFVLAVALALFAGPPARAETVAGRAGIVDGDTFRIGGETVRLFGVDAPELDQTCRRDDGRVWPCGRWSRDEVERRLGGRRLVCAGRGRDRYGRLVATCRLGGADIAAALVRDGVVLAYLRYSADYADEEKAAALAGRGLWEGVVERPEAFRAAERSAAAAAGAAGAPPGCLIKGNVSADGRRIYHLPGSASWAETVISTRKGERWFCSEAEAVAAGWRAAGD